MHNRLQNNNIENEILEQQEPLIEKYSSSDKLLMKEIEHSLAILNHINNKRKIAVSTSLTLALLLTAGAAVTFIYVLFVKTDKENATNHQFDELDNKWHSGPLDREYVWYDDRKPINTCRDLIANPISDFCNDIDRGEGVAGYYVYPRREEEAASAWRNSCMPLIKNFCSLINELETVTPRYDTALAFCIIGAVAIIAGELGLLYRQYKNAKKGVGELLTPQHMVIVQRLCDKLNIRCDGNTKPNALITALEYEKDKLQWTPRMVAFLMGSKKSLVKSDSTPIYRFFNGFGAEPGDQSKDLTRQIFRSAGMMPSPK